jgi:hypothetical protein
MASIGYFNQQLSPQILIPCTTLRVFWQLCGRLPRCSATNTSSTAKNYSVSFSMRMRKEWVEVLCENGRPHPLRLYIGREVEGIVRAARTVY